jgi:hypothetical protein
MIAAIVYSTNLGGVVAGGMIIYGCVHPLIIKNAPPPETEEYHDAQKVSHLDGDRGRGGNSRRDNRRASEVVPTRKDRI